VDRNPPATYARLPAAIRLTRPNLCIQGALYTVLGAYLAGDAAHPLSLAVVGGAFVVGLIIAASFALNDAQDVDVDKLNAPGRLIPSGRVSLGQARAMAVALGGCAVVLAAALGRLPAAMAAVNLALSVAYTYALKGTVLLGNAVIAALDASILLFGSLVVGRVTPAIWALCALAFLHVFAQEVLSALADRDGDAAMGLATTATRLGPERTLMVFRLAIALFAVVAVAAPLVGLLPVRFLILALPCSILPSLAVMATLRGPKDAHTLAGALRVLRYVWIASLLPVFLVRPIG
jgi:geranylgeranylglycerol-phosphate geranylgeranyltransferase